MNPYKELWLEEIGIYATGVIAKNDPLLQTSEVAQQNIFKKSLGTGAIRTAAVLSMADGPLPVGDAVAATGLAIVGAYLLLS